ncbi:hypothetical protein LIER_12457 [Lithospermum erythrorhizon]|uniref:Uncharacterized protein n=1 Tax=Lithospermum erythrorhizon TaxID=34254 RepID=A0AAV3PTU8_LITER
MAGSSRIPSSMTFAAQKESNMNFLPLSPLGKMVLWERKNRTIQEMARVMIDAKKIPVRFWAEAVNTTCYIHNRITLRPGNKGKSLMSKEMKP